MLLTAAQHFCAVRLSAPHSLPPLTQLVGRQQVARAAGALRSAVSPGRDAGGSPGNGGGGDAGAGAGGGSQTGLGLTAQHPEAAAERGALHALRRAAELLCVEPSLAPGGGGGGSGAKSAQAALATAAAEATRRRGLVALPRWLLAPSRYQRHWVRYGLATGVAAFAARFLYRCGRP